MQLLKLVITSASLWSKGKHSGLTHDRPGLSSLRGHGKDMTFYRHFSGFYALQQEGSMITS